jgi:hypothetical protein
MRRHKYPEDSPEYLEAAAEAAVAREVCLKTLVEDPADRCPRPLLLNGTFSRSNRFGLFKRLA